MFRANMFAHDLELLVFEGQWIPTTVKSGRLFVVLPYQMNEIGAAVCNFAFYLKND